MYRILIAAALVAGLNNGCKTTGQDASGLLHEAGQPVQGNEPFLWHAPSRADYVAHGAHALKVNQIQQALPPEHPIAKRLQYWIHQVHTEVLKDRPDLQGILPEPFIYIYPNETLDAFITAVPTCLNAPLLFDTLKTTDTSSGEGESPEVLIEFDSVRASFMDISSFRPRLCLTTPHSQDIDAFIAFFNRFKGACQLSREGQAVRVKAVTSECTRDVASTRAKKFSFASMAAVVNLTTPMINMVENEDQLVSIVVHELGHYYRANGALSAVPGLYNYFFVEDPQRPPHKPVAIANSAAMWQEAQRLSFPRPQDVPGSQMDPYARNIALTLALSHAMEECSGSLLGFCSAACQKFIPNLTDITYFRWNENQRFDAADFPKYLATEPLLKACVETLKLSSAAGDRPAGVVTMGDIQETMSALKYDYLKPPSPSPTLGAVLQLISSNSSQLRHEADAFTARVVAGRLGFYTPEQEADEFSTEMIARIGVNPEAAVAAFHTAMQREAADPRTDLTLAANGISASDCDRLATSQPAWTDAKGLLAKVPLGSLLDPHHGYCYRMFNIDREIAAHHFVAAKREIPLPEMAWDAVQTTANQITEDYKNAPIPMMTTASRPAGAPSSSKIRAELDRVTMH